MATYTCPTCGTRMERDILLFYKHTDQHVVEELKRQNPNWISEDGFCHKCLDFFKQAMGRSGALAGVKTKDSALVNIGIGGAWRRTATGVVLFGVTAVVLFALNAQDAPRFSRLILFVPLFGAMLGLFQARERVCVVLGLKGAKKLGPKEERVSDPMLALALRRASRKILLFSAVFAAVVTLLVCFA